jgi:hypothetical protein
MACVTSDSITIPCGPMEAACRIGRHIPGTQANFPGMTAVPNADFHPWRKKPVRQPETRRRSCGVRGESRVAHFAFLCTTRRCPAASAPTAYQRRHPLQRCRSPRPVLPRIAHFSWRPLHCGNPGGVGAARVACRHLAAHAVKSRVGHHAWRLQRAFVANNADAMRCAARPIAGLPPTESQYSCVARSARLRL